MVLIFPYKKKNPINIVSFFIKLLFISRRNGEKKKEIYNVHEYKIDSGAPHTQSVQYVI